MLASRVRLEEKLLLRELARRCVGFDVLDTRTTVFRLDAPLTGYRAALSREILTTAVEVHA